MNVNNNSKQVSTSLFLRKLTKPELLLIFEDAHHLDGIKLAEELAKQNGQPLERLRAHDGQHDRMIISVQYSGIILIED